MSNPYEDQECPPLDLNYSDIESTDGEKPQKKTTRSERKAYTEKNKAIAKTLGKEVKPLARRLENVKKKEVLDYLEGKVADDISIEVYRTAVKKFFPSVSFDDLLLRLKILSEYTEGPTSKHLLYIYHMLDCKVNKD